MCSSFVFVGVNSKQCFKGPKKAKDESYQLALGNLRSKIFTLRNEALEKDKILLTLVDRLKAREAKLNAQAEAHKAEVENLKKKLAEMNENFEVAKAKREISEMERARVQKNIKELRDSKEKCYEVSMECAKKLKDSFTKVGAYSLEQKFIRGDPEGVIQWIGEEVEAFEEILNDRGDFCAFAGARWVAAILEKTGCKHIKAAAQAEAIFSTDVTPRF
jgi:DNA repair exonuclease SbcCD ATPase subunit